MCSWVCRFSPHTQATPSPGKNCLWNSPVYAWPVRHWTRQPNTSCWSLSSAILLLFGVHTNGPPLQLVPLYSYTMETEVWAGVVSWSSLEVHEDEDMWPFCIQMQIYSTHVPSANGITQCTTTHLDKFDVVPQLIHLHAKTHQLHARGTKE